MTLDPKIESVEDLLKDLKEMLKNENKEKTEITENMEDTLISEGDSESQKYFTFRSDKELKQYHSIIEDTSKSDVNKFFDLQTNYTSLNTGLKKLEKRIKKGKINLLLKNKISKKINTL